MKKRRRTSRTFNEVNIFVSCGLSEDILFLFCWFPLILGKTNFPKVSLIVPFCYRDPQWPSRKVYWQYISWKVVKNGAVLQTASLLINWLTHPFPPNLSDIIDPKVLELGSWNYERMFTPHHVSHVTGHGTGVTCQVSRVIICILSFFRQSGGASRWRVCYQRGLPRLVYILASSLHRGNHFPIY